MTGLVETVVRAFAVLIQELVAAGEDRARQEEALMKAQEKLSRARAKAKFAR